eukprot:SAG31_NODE_31803_length_364_cov_0.566038_2_plen_36_part_01
MTTDVRRGDMQKVDMERPAGVHMSSLSRAVEIHDRI